MKNENIIAEGLGTLLADSYTLMIKTHNYHWNVEGAHFPALHALFEGQYTELFGAVDEIAKRMRALEAKAPAGLHAFSDLTAVKDGDSSKKDKEMVSDLLADHETIISRGEKVLRLAEDNGDAPSADLLTRRLESHQKQAWMLRSFLK